MFIWRKTFDAIKKLTEEQKEELDNLNKRLCEITTLSETRESEIDKLRSIIKNQHDETERYKKECTKLQEIVFKCAAVMAPYMEEKAKK